MQQSISEQVKELQKRREEINRKVAEVVDQRNIEMKRLRKEGKTFEEIGEVFGMSKQRVHTIFEKFED